jgi:hypothetical protein
MYMTTSSFLGISSFRDVFRTVRVTGGSCNTARSEVELLASSQHEGLKAVCEEDYKQPYPQAYHCEHLAPVPQSTQAYELLVMSAMLQINVSVITSPDIIMHNIWQVTVHSINAKFSGNINLFVY